LPAVIWCRSRPLNSRPDHGDISFTDDAILAIVRDYTHRAGVRNRREIANVCRKVVKQVAVAMAQPVESETMVGDEAYWWLRRSCQ